MSGKKFETIGPEHPISVLANMLSGQAFQLAASLRVSRMDVAAAFANAAGQILGDSKDMPRAVALARMDDLRRVMEGAYELRNVKGGDQ